MDKNNFAVMKLFSHRVKVTARPEAMSWLQAALINQDHASQVKVPEGRVRMYSLTGNGNYVDYPDAAAAFDFLRVKHGYPSISSHYFDQRNKRFFWSYGNKRMFIPTDRKLLGPKFIYEMLRVIMADQGVTEEDISQVFDRKTAKSFSNNGSDRSKSKDKPKAEKKADQKVEPISLENVGIDSRTISSLKKSNIKTLEQLQSFVDEKGHDQLITLDGIGEKSSEQLMKILDKVAAKA